MNDVAHGGRTVIFVSHNMGAIKSLCSRAIWIDKGRIAAEGPANTIVGKYLDSVHDGFVISAPKPRDKLVIERVVLRDHHGAVASEFRGGEPITVEVHYHARQRIEHPHFIVPVFGPYGPLFIASMLFDGWTPESIEGDGTISVEFTPPFLLPQTFTVAIGVRAADGVTPVMETKNDVAFFSVGGMMAEYGFQGPSADTFVAESTSMVVPYKWKLPDGRVVTGHAKEVSR
jgi:ABC-type glutathione transport system ATPase component